MAEKEFNTRIVHKHDIQANWEKAVGFIPKQGELIVYDADENYDYQRIKIGDGVKNVNALPFYNDGFVSYSEQNLTDEQKLQARTNIDASDFSGDWTDLINSPISIDKEKSLYTDIIYNPEKNKMTQLADFTNLSILQSIFIKSGCVSNQINRPALASYVYLAFYYKWNDETHNEIAGTIDIDSISLIDSKNYSVNISGSTTDTLYMILDLSTLTEENKALFPTTGLYFKFTYDTAKYKYYYIRAELQFRHVLRSDWISTEIARVSDIPTQIQADWNQTDDTAVDFIKNKPEIATDDDVINALIEADLLCCVADSDGSILTDESENILLW